MTIDADPDLLAPRVLWLYGADAVGKSTIGWEAYTALAERGAHVAYLDTDSLSFRTPPPSNPSELVAASLAALWPVQRATGTGHLVISGFLVTSEDRARVVSAILEVASPSAG